MTKKKDFHHHELLGQFWVNDSPFAKLNLTYQTQHEIKTQPKFSNLKILKLITKASFFTLSRGTLHFLNLVKLG